MVFSFITWRASLDPFSLSGVGFSLTNTLIFYSRLKLSSVFFSKQLLRLSIFPGFDWGILSAKLNLKLGKMFVFFSTSAGLSLLLLVEDFSIFVLEEKWLVRELLPFEKLFYLLWLLCFFNISFSLFVVEWNSWG